jgi:AcrR family transcriptional regulator
MGVRRIEVPLGTKPAERADAARNRQRLIATAREMLLEDGPDRLTMDSLAERSGLGKGTVFRRFGTRAGIFGALLDDGERTFQEQVLGGPPPLGPGAPPLDRLIAYGKARIHFLVEYHDIARAALDGRQPIPPGGQTPISQAHIRMLLGLIERGPIDLDLLAIQLTAALDGPLLLYVSSDAATGAEQRLAQGWQELVQRVCRPIIDG